MPMARPWRTELMSQRRRPPAGKVARPRLMMRPNIASTMIVAPPMIPAPRPAVVMAPPLAAVVMAALGAAIALVGRLIAAAGARGAAAVPIPAVIVGVGDSGRGQRQGGAEQAKGEFGTHEEVSCC